jgi:hypothetical protein
MDRAARPRLLEQAIAELLESETNGSLTLRVPTRDCEPLVVTAMGCSALLAVGLGASVLVRIESLRRDDVSGAEALAAGCERVLRILHGLPRDAAPIVAFHDPVNAAGWLGRRG